MIETRQSGVGLAIRSHLARKLSSLPKGPSEHIMTLALDLDHNINATLISCYAPTKNSTLQEKDDFFDNFSIVMSYVQHRDKLILMEDFNAQVGNDHQVWDGFTGSSWY